MSKIGRLWFSVFFCMATNTPNELNYVHLFNLLAIESFGYQYLAILVQDLNGLFDAEKANSPGSKFLKWP
jgi:hypothetical protein